MDVTNLLDYSAVIWATLIAHNLEMVLLIADKSHNFTVSDLDTLIA